MQPHREEVILDKRRPNDLFTDKADGTIGFYRYLDDQELSSHESAPTGFSSFNS